VPVGTPVGVAVGVKLAVGLTVLVGLGVLLGLGAACTPRGPPPRYDINKNMIVMTRLDLNTNVFIKYSSMDIRNVIRVVQDTILRVFLQSIE